MPSLSLIASEAERLIKPLAESRRRTLQEALIMLCETHWKVLRGPRPGKPLEQLLWSMTPTWSDLLLDLYACGDVGLMTLLQRVDLTQGLALLLLSEIERGNALGAQTAHEPMMAFESATPPSALLVRINSLLRGKLEPPCFHPHSHQEALRKAVAIIAAHTRRLDFPALCQVISLLADRAVDNNKTRDESLDNLKRELRDIGIRFTSIEGEYLFYEQHGHVHKPVRVRQVGEMLLSIRQEWLR